MSDAADRRLSRETFDRDIVRDGLIEQSHAVTDAILAARLFEDALAMTCPSCQHCPPGFDLRAPEEQTCPECGETTVSVR